MVEKVVGYLAHCATIVKGGTTFCHCMYSFLKATKGRCRVRLTKNIKLDLQWWSSFLRVFNGRCPIQLAGSPEVEIYTDASGSGFGGWSGSDYFYGYWDEAPDRCSHFEPPPRFSCLTESNINVKELWPVVVALKRWGDDWKNKHILFHCDNSQVLYMLSKGRSVNLQAMQFLQEIFWHCALYNVTISAKYIPTDENITADKLCRLPLDLCNHYGKISGEGVPYGIISCCSVPQGAVR